MMQALVHRTWEDGSTDTWVPRQKFETLEHAEGTLNDQWNHVVAMVRTQPGHRPPVTIYKAKPGGILCLYMSR